MSNLNIEFLFELFYNLPNEFSKKRRLTTLTDILTFYKIFSERLFLPEIMKGLIHLMKDEYINEILNYVNAQDDQAIQCLAELSRIVDKSRLTYILALIGKLFGSH